MASYVARLRPYAPQQGQVARSYTHAGLRLRFADGVVVHDLSEAQAEVLRPLKQPGKGTGPLLDVCTAEEWDTLLAREAATKLGLPEPVAARVLPVAAPAVPVSVPIEQPEHTDIGSQRVQHTAPAPTPTPKQEAAPPKASARPRKAGGK